MLWTRLDKIDSTIYKGLGILLLSAYGLSKKYRLQPPIYRKFLWERDSGAGGYALGR